jgi:hypothetical protein
LPKVYDRDAGTEREIVHEASVVPVAPSPHLRHEGVVAVRRDADKCGRDAPDRVRHFRLPHVGRETSAGPDERECVAIADGRSDLVVDVGLRAHVRIREREETAREERDLVRERGWLVTRFFRLAVCLPASELESRRAHQRRREHHGAGSNPPSMRNGAEGSNDSHAWPPGGSTVVLGNRSKL